LVREILRFGGPRNLNIEFATNVEQGLLFLKEVSINFVVMETKLPFAEGLRFIKTIRRGKAKYNFDVTMPIFGYADSFETHELFLLRDAGISGLMVRPFSAGVFSKCMHAATLRKFIDNTSYCGPDRRRKQQLDCRQKRREEDRQAELAARLAAEKAAEEALWKSAAMEQAKLDEARKKKEAEAEKAEAARKKAEEEAAAAAAAAAAEVAGKVDVSAMTQEELARHLSKQKK
jgi:DNA-binding NarL/FixJ family response regulator